MLARQRVLVVSDDLEVVMSVSAHLEKDGYQVLAARNGPEARKLIYRSRPDILVVDRSCLQSDALKPGGRLRSDIPIIVLSELGSGSLGTPEEESGVIETVLKPVDPCQILSRVRATLRRIDRSASRGPEEMRCADIVIDRRCHEVRVCGEVVDLTPTEFRLLEVLAGDPGRAFTRLELLGQVFGCDYHGLERTVDTHVKNLRKKLEPDPADPTYIKTVYGVGYKFVES